MSIQICDLAIRTYTKSILIDFVGRLTCRKNTINRYAGMAELADAYGSGPYESNFMQVQVLLPAPNENNPNLTPIGDGFGFVIFIDYPNFNSKRKN